MGVKACRSLAQAKTESGEAGGFLRDGWPARRLYGGALTGGDGARGAAVKSTLTGTLLSLALMSPFVRNPSHPITPFHLRVITWTCFMFLTYS